jgi:hypothetical protein
MSVMETKTLGELSWGKQNERKGNGRTRRKRGQTMRAKRRKNEREIKERG